MALITRLDGTIVSVAADTMLPTQTLTEDQRFFFAHAGYSYVPGHETPAQGRTKAAIYLAEAERFARSFGLSFAWEVSDTDSSDFNDEEPAWQLWDCIAYDDEGNVRASSGANDLGRDVQPCTSNPFVRVTQAELAAEVMDQERAERIEREWARMDTSVPDDTPSLANCDDWGTGEGRFHGRM